jgi:hypothetical protein
MRSKKGLLRMEVIIVVSRDLIVRKILKRKKDSEKDSQSEGSGGVGCGGVAGPKRRSQSDSLGI